MTREDVIALARAGFTRDEITALLGAPAPEPEPAPAPQPDPAPAPAPEPEPAPAPAPAPVPAPAPAQEPVRSPQLDELMQLLRSSNILRDEQPPKESVDDIVANIIRPPRKETK